MNFSKNIVKLLFSAAVAASLVTVLFLYPSSSSAAAGGAAADAAATYKAKCTACHGADGSGNTAVGRSLKIRDLRSAEVQGMSNDALFNVIAKGKNKMPGYEKSLGAATCKALVGYIRTLKH